jgi:hypothetical protein
MSKGIFRSNVLRSSIREETFQRGTSEVTLHEILFGDQIKEDWMGESCSINRRDLKCTKNVGGKPEGEEIRHGWRGHY